MKESQLFKVLKKHLLAIDNSMMFMRIESGFTRLGIPDIFYCTSVTPGWIELKQAYINHNTEKVNLSFRPGQIAWLHNYHKLNGIAFVIGTENSHSTFFIMKASNVREKYNLRNFISLCEYYSIGNIDWKHVYSIINTQ